MLVIFALFVLLLQICPALSAEDDPKSAKTTICAVVRNEEPYVDEWLQYHKYLGFDLINIYDSNIEPSRYLASLSMLYGSFVKVVRWSEDKQETPYENCLKQENAWAAIIDVSEFIVLRKHDNIRAFLQDLAPTGGSVLLNWSIMGNDGIQKRDPALVVSRFIHTSEELDAHVKTIVYTPHAASATIHYTKLKEGHPTVDVIGNAQPNDQPTVKENTKNRSVAYLNRYHTKSFEEYQRSNKDASEAAFEEYNKPYSGLEDTTARDFYFQNHLGKVTYDALFKGIPGPVRHVVQLAHKRNGDEGDRKIYGYEQT